MAVKITYFKKEDFLQQGEFNQFASECKINNLAFRKGDTLKNHEIKQVLDICNKYNGFDINTLIVKGEDDLTIWIEEKSQRTASQDSDNSSEIAAPPSAAQQPLPTKTVTKRYRGQVYEETVVDWAAVQQLNQQKPRRKYRGQYID